MKIESGLQKYDDFFLKAKRIIVKVRIATKSVKALKEQPDFMLKNQELVPLLRSELGSLMTEAGEVGQEGTGLLNSVQSDFSGMNALKAPAILSQLTSTSKELVGAGSEIKDLLSSFGGSSDPPLASGLTKNKKKEESRKEANDSIANSSRDTGSPNSSVQAADFESSIKLLNDISKRNRKFSSYLRDNY